MSQAVTKSSTRTLRSGAVLPSARSESPLGPLPNTTSSPASTPRNDEPSSKALGKRPERVTSGSADPNVSEKEKDPKATEKKRVLPSRASRWAGNVLGPGSSVVDEMILDAQKRAAANKPILPNSAVFLLTTDSSAVASTSEVPYASVFDAPTVQNVCKAKEIIQTPEFTLMPEDGTVGSRLRARRAEESSDTSDAVYINRHRKYETFEKRQRLREKEKLIHERYKLKERIEQLRSMEARTFGGGTEGEAKRRAMLRDAEELERRYDLLLPPEPRKGKKGEVAADGGEEETNPGRPNTPLGSYITHTPSAGTLKLKFKLTPRPSMSSLSNGGAASPGRGSPNPFASQPTAALTPTSTPPPRYSHLARDSSGRFASHTPSPAASTTASSHPPKRIKSEYATSSKASAVPILLAAAQRATAEPEAQRRQPRRQALAFGVKVPAFLEEIRDFELPEWVIGEDSSVGSDVEMGVGDQSLYF
ncbi:hypothetical protein BOTBODRAFT_54513 [Botryobasidium botryosum FD-172 SS1]|uniref:PEHE domain-containing protein n=1 Tax=Botryobasidium botryosum (strain FD-172 SS1) TaxID=930990 RepID=A0A067MLL0_BOTB1|nr:hypothetical protein BOTBODRAFT_54513 [Botryobasidium botryosum FD-172 SS1]